MNPQDEVLRRLIARLDGDPDPESPEPLAAPETPDALDAETERAQADDPELQAEVEASADLIEQLRALPEEIEPENDLWGEIRRRTIDADDQRQSGDPIESSPDPVSLSRRRRWLIAAGLGSVLIASAFVMGRWSALNRAPATEQPVTAQVAAAPGSIVTTSAVTQAERDLASAAARIRLVLTEYQASFPPETRELVEGNLATIETAIAEIESALELAPDDSDLQKLLVAYRQRELGLLEHVTRTATRL